MVLEREGVLLRGTDAIAAATRGGGNALFIVGEAGQGKTSILEILREQARAVATVVVARADPMEASLPFGLMGEVFEQLGYGDVFAADTTTRRVDAIRAERFERARRLLREAASSPLVIGLDDLHWADAESRALLAYLLRRLARLPVAVIATMRHWPPAAEEMTRELEHAGMASIERLVPLSNDAARGLLSELVERDVDSATAERALALTAGNPLLLEQVAHMLRGGTELDDSAGATVEAEDLLLSRFAGLDDPAMRLARAAAVLTSPFDSRLAGGVRQVTDDALSSALHALVGAGLLRTVRGHTVEFVHPFFRWALYSRMPGFERSELHTRAFAILYEQGRVDEAAEHAIRGDVRGAAAADALARAGRRALASGAPEVAAQRLEAAASVAGADLDPEVLLDLTEALASVSPARRVEVCRRLVAMPLTARQRVEATRRLARALAWAGAADEADASFQAAASLAEDVDAGLATEITLDHVAHLLTVRGPWAAWTKSERAVALAGSLDEPMQHVVLALRAMTGLMSGASADLGAVEALAVEQWRRRSSMQPAPMLARWSPWLILGATYVLVERFSEAEAAYREYEDDAEAGGAMNMVALVEGRRAYLRLRQGRIDAALTDIDRSLALSELRPYAKVTTHAVRSSLLLLAGRLEESEEECRRVEGLIAAGAVDSHANLLVLDTRGQRHLHEGRVEAASDAFRALEGLIARLGVGEPCYPPWVHHGAAAHVAADRIADAERVLAWASEAARLLPCRHPRIAVALGSSILAERLGRTEEAERHLTEALDLDPDTTLPIEKVDALLALGSLLRRSRRPTAARRLLSDAASLAERIGAHGLERRCEQELHVAGGRRRRRGEPSTLTAQEQRVVHLAADGLTNREIARRLVLSESTVETHLRRIYAKLGVRSRRDLMLKNLHTAPEGFA